MIGALIWVLVITFGPLESDVCEKCPPNVDGHRTRVVCSGLTAGLSSLGHHQDLLTDAIQHQKNPRQHTSVLQPSYISRDINGGSGLPWSEDARCRGFVR
jgi:hypothetical protein